VNVARKDPNSRKNRSQWRRGNQPEIEPPERMESARKAARARWVRKEKAKT